MEQESCHFAGFCTKTTSTNNLGYPNALRNIVTKVHNSKNASLTWPFTKTSFSSVEIFKIPKLRCRLKIKTSMDTIDLHTF